MTNRRPGHGRYAQLEREQRWLLASLPDGVTNERVIVDHYWSGTSLRLRMIEDETGAIYKLGQKVRVDAGDPQRVKITNMYLSKGEFDQLSVAPATIIAKSRWTLTFDGATFSVDEFKGRHAGLVLAEIELGENDSLVNMPLFAVADVTHDNEYSGGWLADASEADLLRVISELRNR